MKQTLLLAALTLLTAVAGYSAAQADPNTTGGQERWPRWYVGISGGYTYMEDQDISGGPGSASKIKLSDGYGIGGSIGYLPSSSIPFVNSLRFEGEVTYHSNNVKNVNYPNGTSVSGTGNYSTTAYMINTFYDLPIAGSNWSPYIGGGIGVANVHLPNNSRIGNNDDSTSEFAYQGLVGIGYTPETIPDTQWTIGYRYLATSDPGFSNATSEYSTHSVEVGGKFRF